MLEALKSSKLSIRLLFVSGVLLIVLGIVFVLLSLRYEVLDEKYIVREVTTYKSSKSRLKQGQIAVSKDLDYIGEGVYRITYRNYYNAKDSEILSPNSEFGIVDMFGDGYELDLEDITINSDKYEVTEETKVDKRPIVNYYNNTLEIKFPSDLAKVNNIIVVYVNLVGRDLNKKYSVSKETYFNFTPYSGNNYYEKKTAQSYIVEGSAYIKLDKRR